MAMSQKRFYQIVAQLDVWNVLKPIDLDPDVARQLFADARDLVQELTNAAQSPRVSLLERVRKVFHA